VAHGASGDFNAMAEPAVKVVAVRPKKISAC
jgi:hypothetical protein